MKTVDQILDYLFSTEAVRERCGQVFRAAQQNELEYFQYHPERLEAAADYVTSVIRESYPNLDIPYHSRWRHFEIGNHKRISTLRSRYEVNPQEWGRLLFDLVIVSVLLDAGAGPDWHYQEPSTGETYTRSEGLAIASFDMFRQGLFSATRHDIKRVDGLALQALNVGQLSEGFQVNPGNPLVGLEGRTALLNQLGATLINQPEVFGDRPRLGNLLDVLSQQATENKLSAQVILKTILKTLGSIWPGRLSLNAENLGDCWKHPAVHADDASDQLIPFHKLSQWLSYSLLEPLEQTGIEVQELDSLTGLPEYRNGGLFLDTGVLSLRNPEHGNQPHDPGSTLIVEWRALTVCLLDAIHPLIRDRLGIPIEEFPLAKVLQGGTWTAGRKLAKAKRDGQPPIKLNSDGTVF